MDMHDAKRIELLEAIFPVLDRHIGVVNITDAKVLRAELF